MKKIAFITSPLRNSNAVRGVGFYTANLLPFLKAQAPDYGMEIIELNQTDDLYQHRFDLVHYPFFDLFRHTLPLIKTIPTVVTVHDVIPLEYPEHYPPGLKGSVNLFLQKLALGNVARVITDSYASVLSIHKLFHVPHHKLKLVYLAADKQYRPITNPKILKPIAAKYKLPPKFVLYVGDINWNKNLPSLIAACQKIDFPLVIVGRQASEIEKLPLDHPELRHLKSQISNLKSNTHRLGFVPTPDLAAIYNLATVYCQPSFAEGFGLPVLEAMACGTPVACSNTHSLPEVGGDAAIYFDPSSPQQIGESLQTLINDESLRKEYSRRGIIQSAKFNWEETARQTLYVYRELV